ncbi:OmpP1/FadL family transporter [Pseudomonas sp. FEN]|uniref:OmpP1/FadL family transporter n=1 Tax=Pseudomonas sp. FEN TaxID=2767468 RepID=UPI00174AACC9|nr:outer membrane protein transport protein [Pseudomonas sp. FEN]
MNQKCRVTPCLAIQQTPTRWIKLIYTVALIGASTTALANGIALNEESTSSAGTAYAGRSSSALDASTIYGNPAGLTKLPRSEVTGGIALLSIKDNISDVQSNATGTSKGNSVPLAAIPFAYFSTPLDERFSAGLGLYVPFGLINNYESTFQGRYYGAYSKTQAITLQPTLAYRINDDFSIGGGPTLNRFDAEMQNNLATGNLNNGRETLVTIKGNDTAIGYNIGVLFDLSDATRWGVTYHSKVSYQLKGHTEVADAPGVLALNGKYDARIGLDTPESLDTSITHHFNDRWTGYLGTVWTRWSRLDKFEAINSGVSAAGQSLGLDRVGEPLNWHDTWSTALGASYQLDRQWLLRAGYAYDPTPVRNADRSVRIPVGNRNSIALGAAFSPNAEMTIDLAYGYIWDSNTSVRQTNNSGLQPGYSAKYNNSANELSMQLTYRY